MTHCLEACCSLLLWQNTEPFLHHIVTCDEKWILFNNCKCSARLLDKDKIPKRTSKLDFHQKKLMVLVWWFSAGVIHYSFMKPGMAITADVYVNQLHEMMRKLALKQLRLVNKDQPILLQDNAQPHVAQGTLLKIQQWNLEVLSHPLYSPDLAPTDYHFFQALDNFLQGKTFATEKQAKTSFSDFITSCSPPFFVAGINKLPIRWQKCIDALGVSFN